MTDWKCGRGLKLSISEVKVITEKKVKLIGCFRLHYVITSRGSYGVLII